MNRPGDVLIGRYRLDDLISESREGRFWRGYDTVLARPVAVHCLDADDDRAPALMEAARASARISDTRLLRVLDAESDGRFAYVVNEWGWGTSLDLLLAAGGPLPARAAAWVVDEVAGTLAVAHDLGVAHGRLRPESVLIDRNGSIRIIGFAVDAALYGLSAGRIEDDVTDLAGLLHATLTGRWAGVSESAVPPAPRDHDGAGRVLRPRQVRAGIPRVLDDLVDEVLNNSHGRHSGPHSAREIDEMLREYVGDPGGLAEQLVQRTHAHGVTSVPSEPAAAAEPARDLAATQAVSLADLELADPAMDGADPSDDAEDARDAGGTTGEATELGGPVFDDDDATGDWFVPRDGTPPPPPAFEPHPERPLFAPERHDGGPPRRVPHRPSTAGGDEPAAYWPWGGDVETPVPDDRGRGWLRLAIGLAISLAAVAMLVLGLVTAYHLGREHGLLGDEATPAPTEPTTEAARAHRINGLTATDLDPHGGDGAENPESTANAVDGDSDTTWRTATYKQDFGPQGLKPGVGIVVDLHRRSTVTEIDLDWAVAGATVSLYLTDAAPTADPSAVPDLTPVAELTVQRHSPVRLVTPAAGRFLTVWITGLPQVSDGWRAELAEVVVSGS